MDDMMGRGMIWRSGWEHGELAIKRTSPEQSQKRSGRMKAPVFSEGNHKHASPCKMMIIKVCFTYFAHQGILIPLKCRGKLQWVKNIAKKGWKAPV
jgi:hypothetical protein